MCMFLNRCGIWNRCLVSFSEVFYRIFFFRLSLCRYHANWKILLTKHLLITISPVFWSKSINMFMLIGIKTILCPSVVSMHNLTMRTRIVCELRHWFLTDFRLMTNLGLFGDDIVVSVMCDNLVTAQTKKKKRFWSHSWPIRAYLVWYCSRLIN